MAAESRRILLNNADKEKEPRAINIALLKRQDLAELRIAMTIRGCHSRPKRSGGEGNP
jgi:hypothetical protein